MNKKINLSFVIVGIITIIVFVLVFKFTYTSRYIRINGELRYCPISNIHYGRKDIATVLIDGQKLDAGELGTHRTAFGKRINALQVGDTIAVRYIKGKSRVVQNDVKSGIYYFYFGLESILLIVGITLIIGGFMGKSIYSQSSRQRNKFANNKRRKK
jgi:hypothetical protein